MKDKNKLATWIYNNIMEFEKEELSKKLIHSFLVDFEDSAFANSESNEVKE